MSECAISPKSILVGPELVKAVLYFVRRNPLYLDVGGTAHHVLGIDTAPDRLIVSRTSTPTVNINWDIELLPKDLKYRKQFRIYSVKSTAALAGEFGTREVA